MADDKPKRNRKPRRNFQQSLTDLRSYCRIKVDVLKSIDKDGKDPLWQASIEAYADILARIPE